MKKHLTVLCLILSFSQIGLAQFLHKASKESHYRLVYALNSLQTKNITLNSLSIVDSSYFNNCVDTIALDESFKKSGNYLIASLDYDRLRLELLENRPFKLQVLNNQSDFNVVLIGDNNRFVNNAQVFLEGKKVKFSTEKGLYQLPKRHNKGLLQIDFEGESYYEIITTNYPSYAKKLKNRIVYSFPLKYLTFPLVNWIKYHNPTTFVRNIQAMFREGFSDYFEEKKEQKLEQKYSEWQQNSVVFLNKPKYLPKDTVRFKVVLMDKKGRYLDKPFLDVKIGAYSKKVITNLKPYSKGLFEGYFVLTDSLKLKLNQSQYLRFMDDEDELASTSFQYADYTPNAELFEIKIDENTYYQTDTIQLALSAFDENGIAISDARYSLKVQTQHISKIDTQQIFVPTLYWTKSGNMPASGKETITFPDSLKKNFSGSFQIIVDFTTADNKVFSKTAYLNYYSRKRTLEELRSKQQRQAAIPFSVTASRNIDSLQVTIQNPEHKPYWYALYYKNRKLEERFDTTSKSISFHAKRKKDYSIAYHYLANDKVKTASDVFRFSDKLLQLDLDAPSVISPGQEVDMTVSVTDAFDKPQSDVDLTAFAFTNKFKESSDTYLKNYSKIYKARKVFNNFFTKDNRVQYRNTTIKKPDWLERFAVRDSLFYQFLFPQNGLFTATIPVENRTEFAPYIIENGEYQDIKYLVVDHVPVYLGLAAQSQRYSFRTDNQPHNLLIRTSTKIVELNNVVFKPNHKTILGIDPTKGHPNIEVTPLSSMATPPELAMLNDLLMPIRKTVSLPKNSYIKQKERVFYIDKKQPEEQIIGPVFETHVDFLAPNISSLEFKFEKGYRYEVLAPIIKMKPNESYTSYNFNSSENINQAQDVPTHIDFDEVAWTEEEILLKDKIEKEKEAKPVAQYKVPSTTTENHTKLNLLYKAFRENRYLKHIILFKDNEPNFIRIYPASTSVMHELEQCEYTLYLLWNNNDFSEIPVRKLYLGGLNAILISDNDIQKSNEKSEKMNGLVLQSLYGFDTNKLSQLKQIYQLETPINYRFDTEEHSIFGTITDSENQPIPGVSINIKGTSKGVMTDQHGQYRLLCPPNSVLVVTAIGYSPTEYIVKNAILNNITLLESETHLDEVVVMGYGAQLKQALVGRAAGVAIRGTSGVKFLPPEIKADDDMQAFPPVYVLNGKLVNEYDDREYEVSEVLKGQTATALYGSRAQGGVFVLQKKGAVETTPAIRKNFKDDAFWQPKLTTDHQGKAHFKVKFPDDLTTWNTHIAATSANRQTGMMQTVIKSFRAVSANLSVPRFLVEGDSVQVYGKVKNYRTDSLKVKTQFKQKEVALKSSEISVIGSKMDSVFVKASNKDTLALYFGIKTQTNIQDAEERKVPVYAQGTIETTGTFKVLEKDSSLTYNTKQSSLNISALATSLEVYEQEIKHLHNYQYYCNEQLASKLKAYLLQQRIDSRKGKAFTYEKDVRKIISQLLNNVNTEQKWGWWGIAPTSSWISEHVVETLYQAQKQGFEVKFDFKLYAQKELYQVDNKSISEKLKNLLLLRKLDTLLKVNAFLPKYDSIKILTDKINYKLLLLSQGQKIDLADIFKEEKTTILGGIYYGMREVFVYENEFLNTLKVYQILKQVGGYESKLNKIRQYFYEVRNNTGYWRNTYESALVLDILGKDVKVDGTVSKPSLQIEIDGKTTVETTFPYQKEMLVKDKVKVKSLSSAPVFVSVFEQKQNTHPQKVESDFVVNTYFEGNKTKLKTAQKTKLIVEVEVKKDADYVMLEVPIPAGCIYTKEVQNYWFNNSYYTEQYKNKQNYYFTKIHAGKYRYEIELTSTFAGKFSLNPAKIELMYFPVFFGREGEKSVVIE